MRPMWSHFNRKARSLVLIVAGGTALIVSSILFVLQYRGWIGILVMLGGLALFEGLWRRTGVDLSREHNAAQKKIAEMISSAQQRIQIVTGALNAQTYGPLVDSILQKVRDGVDV